ncbi:MAG: AI-2E family transporter [Lachnospiraceae bacterium]|nr:AI-2E family transporter [Lachnospiraceae bacterium]
MKWRPDKNQIRWGVTLFVVSVSVLFVYYLLFHGSKLTAGVGGLLHAMMPVLYGIVIAYVLSPVLHFTEKRFFAPHYKKKGIDLHDPANGKAQRHVRRWSILITIVFFLLIVGILLMVIIPQLIKSVQSIVKSFPTYVGNITRMSNTYLADHPDVAATLNSYLGQASAWITDFTNNTVIPQATLILRRLSRSVIGFMAGVFNFIIGIIVAVYLLNGKETFKSQGKKFVYSVFKEKTANELISGARYAHYTFSGFIVGKLVDSLIVGIVCYIGARILKTSYPMLMAVIVGVTNIIPFFGPYIGEILTFLLLFLIHPISALVFFAFLFVLQQFDGNILGPKILGNSTGLSSFWVIFSVLFFGNLFGVVGWILGVPLFAVFYAFIGRLEDRALEKRGLPTETELYGEAAYVEKGRVVPKKDADWDLYHVRHPQSIWKRIFRVRKEVGSRLSGVVHSASAGDRREADGSDVTDDRGIGNGDQSGDS